LLWTFISSDLNNIFETSLDHTVSVQDVTWVCTIGTRREYSHSLFNSNSNS